MKILLQPHDDDAFLFACFAAIREQALIVTVFDSYVQPSRGIPGTSARERERETNRACIVLGLLWKRLNFRDDEMPTLHQVASRLGEVVGPLNGHEIWAPADEAYGHPQHNLLAPLGDHHYLTYTERGKSTCGREVPFEPAWVGLKLRALSCFESQFQAATGCVEHFIGRSLREYEI